MSARYRDPEWLREKYHGDGLTQREIAEDCGVSPRTIRKYMTEFGIETRDVAGENHPLFGEERSEETKRKISETLEGRTFSEETRSKISTAQRGRSLPESVRTKIADSIRGLSRSEEPVDRRTGQPELERRVQPAVRSGVDDRLRTCPESRPRLSALWPRWTGTPARSPSHRTGTPLSRSERGVDRGRTSRGQSRASLSTVSRPRRTRNDRSWAVDRVWSIPTVGKLHSFGGGIFDGIKLGEGK